MFPSSFPFFDYHRHHHGHHHHGHHGHYGHHGYGGIYNNLIVNAPYEHRHEHWRPYYWHQYPIINETSNMSQGLRQSPSS